MYLGPVESQSLAALEREIVIMKSIIYVSKTANQHTQHTPPKKPKTKTAKRKMAS